MDQDPIEDNSAAPDNEQPNHDPNIAVDYCTTSSSRAVPYYNHAMVGCARGGMLLSSSSDTPGIVGWLTLAIEEKEVKLSCFMPLDWAI
eukprot:scaffold4240_cov163-Amphora_coffeaeformis.AAC.2